MNGEMTQSKHYEDHHGNEQLDSASECEYSTDEFSDDCSCSSCCSTCSECDCEMCIERDLHVCYVDECLVSETSSTVENIQGCNGFNNEQNTNERTVKRTTSALKKVTPNLSRIGNKLKKVIHKQKKGRRRGKIPDANGHTDSQLWQPTKSVKKRVTFSDVSSSIDEEQYLYSSQSDTSANTPICNGHSLQNTEICNLEQEPPHENKSKRKCSISSNDNDMEAELFRLQSVLKAIDPQKLQSVLKHSLKKKRPETVLALATLLPKKKFTADTIHCVRCHQEYHPLYGRTTCTLYHPERGVHKMAENVLGADFLCQFCGINFRVQGGWDYTARTNLRQDCGYCYRGVHTPITEEVDYEPVGIAKSCEDKGCIVFYV